MGVDIGTILVAMAELRDTLWRAADKLRGSMDAGQYKDVVLGLVFLRHAAGPARWDQVAAAAHAQDERLGELIDAALTDAALTEAAAALGTLQQRRLAELITLISDAPGRDGVRDLLGEVYEYFVEKFARAEGRRGGEFYTPASVVKLLVEVLQPYAGTVYDPCCGSGGMFVQAEKIAAAHRGSPADLRVFGQEYNARTWRLAQMNLAIHGIAADLGDCPADTFHADAHPGLAADYILANPPFNMSDWARDPRDKRWAFGVPPAANANFAWLQHIITKMAPTGTSATVLANASTSARQSGEGAIRAGVVEADLVACLIALPTQLFRSTSIPACLWFLAADKGARRGQVLFIDARAMGTLISRTERKLSDRDILTISATYHAWRGTSVDGAGYADVPGFCYSATLAEIREGEHILTPGRYVGTPQPPADSEPREQKISRLKKELLAALDDSARLEQVVRAHLEALGRDEGPQDGRWPSASQSV